MKQSLVPVFNIINNKNLTDNEWNLIDFFHEELSDATVNLRAENGIATTFFCDGIFAAEQNGKPFVFRRGAYEDQWPNIATANKFKANFDFAKILSNCVINNTICEFPDVKFLSAHFHVEFNDGDVAGIHPWNLAQPMPSYIKSLGFDGGWSSSWFFRFNQ